MCFISLFLVEHLNQAEFNQQQAPCYIQPNGGLLFAHTFCGTLYSCRLEMICNAFRSRTHCRIEQSLFIFRGSHRSLKWINLMRQIRDIEIHVQWCLIFGTCLLVTLSSNTFSNDWRHWMINWSAWGSIVRLVEFGTINKEFRGRHTQSQWFATDYYKSLSCTQYARSLYWHITEIIANRKFPPGQMLGHCTEFYFSMNRQMGGRNLRTKAPF